MKVNTTAVLKSYHLSWTPTVLDRTLFAPEAVFVGVDASHVIVARMMRRSTKPMKATSIPVPLATISRLSYGFPKVTQADYRSYSRETGYLDMEFDSEGVQTLNDATHTVVAWYLIGLDRTPDKQDDNATDSARFDLGSTLTAEDEAAMTVDDRMWIKWASEPHSVSARHALPINFSWEDGSDYAYASQVSRETARFSSDLTGLYESRVLQHKSYATLHAPRIFGDAGFDDSGTAYLDKADQQITALQSKIAHQYLELIYGEDIRPNAEPFSTLPVMTRTLFDATAGGTVSATSTFTEANLHYKKQPLSTDKSQLTSRYGYAYSNKSDQTFIIPDDPTKGVRVTVVQSDIRYSSSTAIRQLGLYRADQLTAGHEQPEPLIHVRQSYGDNEFVVGSTNYMLPQAYTAYGDYAVTVPDGVSKLPVENIEEATISFYICPDNTVRLYWGDVYVNSFVLTKQQLTRGAEYVFATHTYDAYFGLDALKVEEFTVPNDFIPHDGRPQITSVLGYNYPHNGKVNSQLKDIIETPEINTANVLHSITLHQSYGVEFRVTRDAKFQVYGAASSKGVSLISLDDAEREPIELVLPEHTWGTLSENLPQGHYRLQSLQGIFYLSSWKVDLPVVPKEPAGDPAEETPTEGADGLTGTE